MRATRAAKHAPFTLFIDQRVLHGLPFCVPSLWRTYAIGMAQLCHHYGARTPSVWHTFLVNNLANTWLGLALLAVGCSVLCLI